MPEVNVGSVPFQEAINHFRGKLNIPSKRWDDLRGDINAKAFTIAGATKADLLSDMRAAVDDAISQGTTITDFRKKFDETVQKHGWTYKGKRGWRTRVIYDNNMRTARMAGKWEQFQRTKDTRPYLLYITVGDDRVRPEHRRWHYILLHIDDPWWTTHYPPNGWGCRCTVRSLSLRQIRKSGLQITDISPPLEESERINVGTGEIYGDVPKGIDVGWNYNVGQAWLGPDIAFGEKIMALPVAMRNQALTNAGDITEHLEKSFSPWVTALRKRKQPAGEIRTVGYLTPRLVDELIRRNDAPTTAVITTTDREVMHMIRESKDGKHLPIDMLRAMPLTMNSAKAVLWDKRDPGLLYVFDVPGEQRAGKLVIRVNYKTKARTTDDRRHNIKTNALRTGGLVQLQNLKDRNVYDVIQGEL